MAHYRLHVNGTTVSVDAEPRDSLLSVLRNDLLLTGSKYGCGEGQCGACTVLIGDEPVRSCITRMDTIGDRAVTTVEGLADGDRLHPVQQAFIEAEAFQCGYCTPGMVMAAAGLLRAVPRPSEADIVRSLDRHVCRCGAYSRIVRAVRLASGQDTPGEGQTP